jgi:hypothetical protein
MDLWTRIGQIPGLQGAVKHVTTRSVMSAPITLTAIVTPITLLLSLFADPQYRMYFLLIAAAPVAWFVVQNLIWTIVAPDRLHDERTQTAWRKLAIYGDSKNAAPMIDAEAVANPALPTQEAARE